MPTVVTTEIRAHVNRNARMGASRILCRRRLFLEDSAMIFANLLCPLQYLVDGVPAATSLKTEPVMRFTSLSMPHS